MESAASISLSISSRVYRASGEESQAGTGARFAHAVPADHLLFRPMRRLGTAVALVSLLAVPAASANAPNGEPGLPVAGGKARLVVAGGIVRGTGFHASEHVQVSVLQAHAKRIARRMTAGAGGTFVLRLSSTLDRCAPTTVVAIGDKGSHATYRVPRLLC